MADDPRLVVIRVETRKIAMRPLLTVIRASFKAPEFRVNIREVEPQNRDSFEFTDRLRSIVHGVVATAKKKKDAILCVHVAFSPLTFEHPDHPKITTDIGIVAVAGPVTRLRFSVRANPLAEISPLQRQVLLRSSMQMQAELPDFPEPLDPELRQYGITLGKSVIDRMFYTLFEFGNSDLARGDKQVH